MHSLPTTQAALRLDDTAVAFAYKNDTELYKALALFSALDVPLLARFGPRMAEWALGAHLPVRGLIRSFFFSQFCGGESLQVAKGTIERMGRLGVGATLDYAVEAQHTDAGYDACVSQVQQALHYAAENPYAHFVAVKLTGLGDAEVFARVQAGKPHAADHAALDRTRQRLDSVCALAAQLRQPIMIDAEESWTQDVMDELCENMMAKYNQQEALIYTTVQMYRQDRLDYLKQLIAKTSHFLGIKLVRGAYLEKENERAVNKGYPTPIHFSKRLTDQAFDAAAKLCLDNRNRVALCLGTHNERSSMEVVRQMQAAGIEAQWPGLTFSQLYGMSDNLSFNLAKAGYRVAKYLPYGPVEAVMPYLFRRAQENSSIAGQSSRELQMIRREVFRRRKAR